MIFCLLYGIVRIAAKQRLEREIQVSTTYHGTDIPRSQHSGEPFNLAIYTLWSRNVVL